MADLRNLDAERSVLGAVLLENAALDRLGTLEPADFSSEAHRRAFEAMQAMAGHGQPIDFLTLQDHLRARGLLDKAGGPVAVSALPDAVPSAANADAYARIVREICGSSL